MEEKSGRKGEEEAVQRNRSFAVLLPLFSVVMKIRIFCNTLLIIFVFVCVCICTALCFRTEREGRLLREDRGYLSVSGGRRVVFVGNISTPQLTKHAAPRHHFNLLFSSTIQISPFASTASMISRLTDSGINSPCICRPHGPITLTLQTSL